MERNIHSYPVAKGFEDGACEDVDCHRYNLNDSSLSCCLPRSHNKRAEVQRSPTPTLTLSSDTDVFYNEASARTGPAPTAYRTPSGTSGTMNCLEMLSHSS
ncbi:hypothetical protein EVAR_63799_1 [Eumeta japonica]|uniref:Uncharacterized protein n=1 Tax=Eumeta variegata TaxID=151549 RepID=A0A4C1ZQB3_EUMVA|nr:hypothetical protein EVAR_63799_1 [Eumeta japonica]